MSVPSQSATTTVPVDWGVSDERPCHIFTSDQLPEVLAVRDRQMAGIAKYWGDRQTPQRAKEEERILAHYNTFIEAAKLGDEQVATQTARLEAFIEADRLKHAPTTTQGEKKE